MIFTGELEHYRALHLLATAIAANSIRIAAAIEGMACMDSLKVTEALAIAGAVSWQALESSPTDLWSFALPGLSAEKELTSVQLLQELSIALYCMKDYLEHVLGEIRDAQEALTFAEAMALAEAVAEDAGWKTELSGCTASSTLTRIQHTCCCVKKAVLLQRWEGERSYFTRRWSNSLAPVVVDA